MSQTIDEVMVEQLHKMKRACWKIHPEIEQIVERLNDDQDLKKDERAIVVAALIVLLFFLSIEAKRPPPPASLRNTPSTRCLARSMILMMRPW